MTLDRVTSRWYVPAVTPLPQLDRLLSNLWWTWDADARRLVESIDPSSWRACKGMVGDFLARVSRERWRRLRDHVDFNRGLDETLERLDAYVGAQDTWWNEHHADALPGGIAYFSMEFGLHEGLPIYSGGLGVLAGDHLKSASDLGLPFVAVGLFYREGYFHQSVDETGRQHEVYTARTPADVGLQRALGAGGQPLEVFVPLYDRYVRCEVWKANVGRIPLYLLDTDVAGNRDEDRWLTKRLYGGDPHNRIGQEMLLGVGGLRTLRGVGCQPDVMHLNEGHTAFVVLERLREELAAGSTRDEAWAEVRRSTVFTTHTPVPAGHDRFWYELVDNALGRFVHQIGLYPGEVMDLGRVQPGHDEEHLCMTVLALKGSRAANGVSHKHGEVSRDMWRELDGTGTPTIGHITNGVHAPSWVGPSMQDLLDRHLGPAWRRELPDGRLFGRVFDIPGRDVWEAHNEQKRRLVEFVATRTGERIPADALVIGFARRFATYKRGDMVLSHPERLAELMGDPERPVVLLYAGKAHPRDEHGKSIIRNVVNAAGRHDLHGHVLFIEDYDIGVGRALVQGVDLWLNNPRRPLEASGTSGQKVSMNGGLNCSTLDGWWIEGFAQEPRAGWAVGSPEPSEDVARGDAEDTDALYKTLIEEVVPTFWRRDGDGLPSEWVERMTAAIAVCRPAFNTDRMVADYVTAAYLAR